jgi:hypothetical protein
MAFDPFERAWNTYNEGGLEALEVIEAPLFVVAADPELAQAVTERNEGVEPGFLKWMILPDATPVAPDHLVVVGGRQASYDDATDVERHVMDTLTHATSVHIKDLIHPVSGTGVYRFGNQAPTMHAHVVSRTQSFHGLDWNGKREFIPVEQRREMRDRVAFDEAGVAELHQRVAKALLRFA